jgi:hypothetical protein
MQETTSQRSHVLPQEREVHLYSSPLQLDPKIRRCNSVQRSIKTNFDQLWADYSFNDLVLSATPFRTIPSILRLFMRLHDWPEKICNARSKNLVKKYTLISVEMIKRTCNASSGNW